MSNEIKQNQISESPAHRLSIDVRVREVVGDDACPQQSAPHHDSLTLRVAILLAVMSVAGIYTGLRIGHGWVPADDGTLSQSALRVLQGQLPQRDFNEIYTGGLSVIHAMAFRIFGVNLMSLRMCVFLFFLAWIPAFYWIALRFTRAVSAGLITLVAVAWSYPNYPAAMPSWYNLFFATFGAAALLRYLEVRARKWLFIAGVCGGISVLIKVIGVYYIAGALLFLVFLEQSQSRNDGDVQKGNWLFRAFCGASLLAYLGCVVLLLRSRLGLPEMYAFVLPSTVIVGTWAWSEIGIRAGTTLRFQSLLDYLIPFIGGILAPVCIFLIPYAVFGAVGKFFTAVASSAISRAAGLGVIRPAGPTYALLYSLPLLIVLLAAMYWKQFQSIAVGAALGLGGIAIVYRATQSGEVASGAWCSVAALTPMAIILGAFVALANKQTEEVSQLQRKQVVLLISLSAACCLVAFPFAAPIYICYAIPLTLLALVAAVSAGKKQRGTYALGAMLCFYLLFGVVILVPHYIYELTHIVGKMEPMRTPRAGGLQVEGGPQFDDFAHFLRTHAPNGKMYAGNDCPALYFLSGLQNVTSDDGGASDFEVLKALQSDDLKLVVINEAPFFAGGRMSPRIREEVARNFPESKMFGIFHVYWRQ